MRYFWFLMISFFIFSCQNKNETSRPTWLYGKWKRVNEKPEKSTYDFWNKDLTGIGFTLKKNDTVFKERMSIITQNNNLYLKVEGVNETPTLFKFIKQTSTSFTCENKQNEFPKKINYFLEGKQLKCKISNEEFSVDFIFDKIH